MSRHGIVFYGPPAAGKDTVTEALRALSDDYQLYPRLKVGPGRRSGYRMGTAEQLETLRKNGEIVWENSRYDATYVIDSSSLSAFLESAVPIVHLGQPDAVEAVLHATPDSSWLVVHLWCPREVAAKRIAARATGDTDARLRAWDVTPELPSAALRINTGVLAPEQAALAIRGADTPGSAVQTSTAEKRRAS